MLKLISLIGLSSAVNLANQCQVQSLSEIQSKAQWSCFFHGKPCLADKNFNPFDMYLFYWYWIKEDFYGHPLSRDHAIDAMNSMLKCAMSVDTEKAQINLNSIVTHFSNLNIFPWILFGQQWYMAHYEWAIMLYFLYVYSGFSYNACDWWYYISTDYRYEDIEEFLEYLYALSFSEF